MSGSPNKNTGHHALVFDSGVGGLSVVSDMRLRLPGLHQSYVADDAFRPYGDKSEVQLRARLPGLLFTLTEMLDPDIVVIACNTASTTALRQIRAALDIPVIGVVPAIKPAAKASRSRTMGVLGTPGTVRRQYVDRLISDFASDCEVVLRGSTRLVAQAEAKLAGRVVDMSVIAEELAPLFAGQRGAQLDAVVLACTHFPLLREELQAVSRQSVQWIDSGAAIARRVETVLANIEPRATLMRPETAFLIGPDAEAARVQAFADYGFTRTVGLVPAP